MEDDSLEIEFLWSTAEPFPRVPVLVPGLHTLRKPHSQSAICKVPHSGTGIMTTNSRTPPTSGDLGFYVTRSCDEIDNLLDQVSEVRKWITHKP